MSRVIILLLDSFGIGAAPDAELFGDKGADTLGHIVEWCAANRKNTDGSVKYLNLPNLAVLGLEEAAKLSRNKCLTHTISDTHKQITGAYGYACSVSKGKDTLSGHWEIAGVPVDFDWGYFPVQPKCFPEELVKELITRGKLPGVLGEKHASGTEIIKELGQEHCRSGKPIIYTSADSVLQIAAHEQYFGLERLYELCHLAYELVKPYHIARVIARPFIGENADEYVRTGNRHDYAVPAPAPTLLDKLLENGGQVHAVGKIADIFAHRGITKHYPASGLEALLSATMEAMKEAPEHSIVFTNFVDFDSAFGHRRDALGYAEGLEYFDRCLPKLQELLQPTDLVLITADHGCDPTWRGSDHTREKIPVLFGGEFVRPQALPQMNTFADLGQTIANYLGFELEHGQKQDIFKKV